MKLTIRQAINKNCKECTYDPKDKGTWVEQIEACTITSCAFHEHRKLTSKTKALNKQKELDALPDELRQIELEKTEKRRVEFTKRVGIAGIRSISYD